MATIVTYIVSIVLPDSLPNPEAVAGDILDNMNNDDFVAPAEFALNVRDYNGAAAVPALPDPGPSDREINTWNAQADELAARNSRDFVCILRRDNWPN